MLDRVIVRLKKGKWIQGLSGGGGGWVGSLNKVALAHFDPFDLLKLNYSDPRTLEHEAAEATVYSRGERKNSLEMDQI